MFDQNGTLKFTHRYAEALRSDGASMREAQTDVVHQRTIYFANGDEVRTNELRGRKSTYPGKRAGQPIAQRDPRASCTLPNEADAGWRAEGADAVAGYRAVRLVHSSKGRTLSIWHALDAQCAVIKLRLEHETGVTEQNLASLVSGEPDPALFQASEAYQEVPPSRLLDPICKDGKCDDLAEAVKQKLDRTYYSLRLNSPEELRP